MSFKQKVLETIKKFKMFKRGDRVLVAVSGGPDSVALIYVLNSFKKELGISLHIAHLNHLLRGNQSRRDMEFTETLAKKLNIPFHSEVVDVKRISEKGSLEEVGREARQKFFMKLAKKYSLLKIVLGHNRDDQAETVLMRLIRGSGLYGLQAIVPYRVIKGFTFVRPLIETPRSQISSYLKRLRVKPCLDSSNLDSQFFRNRIRNRLLPLLESDFNKNIRSSLVNLAQILSLDYDYLAKTAKAKAKGVIVSKRGRKILLDLGKFSKLHISLQRMILRFCIRDLVGSTRKFDYRHWQEFEDLLLNRPEGAIVDLPKGLSIKKETQRIRLYLR